MRYRKKVLTTASEDRLEQLIEARLKPRANKENIDKRIWDLFGETWCVMFTDLSGFSRNVAKFGITHFLQTIYEAERILIPIIESHDGILLKVEGDSFLVIFRRTESAITAGIEMQKTLKGYNKKKSKEEQVLLCVGLGYGEMLRIGDEDVFGSEVNAASKLGEDTAEAWEILATSGVKENVKKIKGISFKEIPDTPPGADKAYKIVYKL